jgi:formylglycine-generating enzyme required for sulfatase activity
MIRIDSMCIDSTEVTAGQYVDFARTADAAAFVLPTCEWNTTFQPDFPDDQTWPPTPATENYPVVGIDWCDAVAFCRWAGKNLCGAISAGGTVDTSNGYRDSTLAQWFKACSHDGQRAFPYPGDASADACASEFRDFGGPGGTAEVRAMKGCEGGYAGIFDMAGNAEEWIDACDSTDPKSYCIVQGGSTSYNTPGCATDTSFTRDTTSAQIGFRCCARL